MNRETILCLYSATIFTKRELRIIKTKYQSILEKEKYAKHITSRRVSSHRKGNYERKIKSLSQINKRISLINSYFEILKNNPELKLIIKDVNIEKDELKKWLISKITTISLAKKHLTI